MQTETTTDQRTCCIFRDWDWSGAWEKLCLKPKTLKRLDRIISGRPLRAQAFYMVPMTPGRGIAEMCLLNKHSPCARGSLTVPGSLQTTSLWTFPPLPRTLFFLPPLIQVPATGKPLLSVAFRCPTFEVTQMVLIRKEGHFWGCWVEAGGSERSVSVAGGIYPGNRNHWSMGNRGLGCRNWFCWTWQS